MFYCICRLKQSLTKCVISYPFRYCFIYIFFRKFYFTEKHKKTQMNFHSGTDCIFILNNRMFYEYLKQFSEQSIRRCGGFLFQKICINFTSEFYRFSLPFAALFSIHKCVFVSCCVFFVCYFIFFIYFLR